MLLLMQFEMRISTRRYFPAIGTAGLLRVAVSGYNLVPAPPPKIIATTCLLCIPVNLNIVQYTSLCWLPNSNLTASPFCAVHAIYFCLKKVSKRDGYPKPHLQLLLAQRLFHILPCLHNPEPYLLIRLFFLQQEWFRSASHTFDSNHMVQPCWG